ncbi:MAG: cation diffusion facilitator family transporter, partial [Halothiobacillaceae bacterium]|nr:cation diffusion facilitator family transporter [Halothiobacillaceae bacterium]
MTTTADSKARLLRWVTTASVATAVLLILSKLVATLMTNSVSVMASLIDSLMDLFASLVTLFAVRWSLQPPDADHRFGHGKAEPLAALAQATFVAGSGAFLILQGVQRLLRPQPVEDIGLGIGVMLFSILATLALD